MATTVLLVEDDGLVLEMLKCVFEQRGFTVFTATSGGEAVSALKRASFDVVVTDMRMETSTSGFDVVRAAKAQHDPPIAVILSAYPLAGAAWRHSGADAMFMKGADVKGMLDDLQKL